MIPSPSLAALLERSSLFTKLKPIHIPVPSLASLLLPLKFTLRGRKGGGRGEGKGGEERREGRGRKGEGKKGKEGRGGERMRTTEAGRNMEFIYIELEGKARNASWL